MKIIVSSRNPVKINATLEGFKQVFPNEKFEVEGVSARSSVSAQPMDEQKTYQGALNRAENAFKEFPEASYWVGIEGGIEKKGSELIAFAWVYIKSIEFDSKSRTASYFLPNKIISLINEGKDLGDAVDMISEKNNSKQKNGFIGILTGDLITRTSLYESAIIMALIPFKNEDLYLN